MKLSSLLLGSGLLALTPAATDALNILRSTSLSTCMEDSSFSATLFNVSFTPDDGQLKIAIKYTSSITGYVQAKISVLAYGFPVMSRTLDPCKTDGLSGMCPMSLGSLAPSFQETIDESTRDQIPGITYRIPDLDGVARVEIIDEGGARVACVEAPLSNGQTVEQSAVGWVTAVISGLAILASALVSGMGHSSAAAHIAANALSVFGYFQAQAMVAMMAVRLPPLAAAWAQNFAWAVGIINIGFMQEIFHWYIQATSGAPANLFKQQESMSVQVAKRSLMAQSSYLSSRAAAYGFEQLEGLTSRATGLGGGLDHLGRRDLAPRSNNDAVTGTQQLIRVTGIERMSYKAEIEKTNFFMTGMSFFVAFVCLVMLLVSGFRALCRTRIIKQHRFPEFRAKWLVLLKGIMYRVVLIGFPQMAILCTWEWVHRDSPAAVVLAVFFFLSIVGTLGWACFKILTIGQHSNALNKTMGPAYTLYSDPAALNRWGYLYVQFRTDRYYYIAAMLVYILAKALTIAFGQSAGVAQSIVVMVIELGYLVAVSTLRPWLDRRTNIVNIGIAVINFINSVFVFMFSGVTKAPAMVPGVLGVIFFIANAVFALVLLVILLVAVGFALFSKDPEERYRDSASLPTSEKAPTAALRDLDADPAPSAEFVAETNLHDEGSRQLSSRSNESERAVCMERGLSMRTTRSPRLVWEDTPLPPSRGTTNISRVSGEGPAAGSGGSIRSRQSLRSQRSGPAFTAGGYAGSVASAAGSVGMQVPSANHYEAQHRQPGNTQGQGMNWHTGVGFER